MSKLLENELLKDKVNNYEMDVKKLKADLSALEGISGEYKTLVKKYADIEKENYNLKVEYNANSFKLQRQMDEMREKYEKEIAGYKDHIESINFKYGSIVKYGNDLKCLELEKLGLKDENLKLENLYRDAVIYEKIKYAKKVEEFCNETAKSVLLSKKIILKRALDQIQAENKIVLLKNQEFADELEKQAELLNKFEHMVKEKDRQIHQLKIELDTQKAIGKTMCNKNNTFLKLINIKSEREKDIPVGKSLKSTFYESKSASQINLFSSFHNSSAFGQGASSMVTDKLQEALNIIKKIDKLGQREIILNTPAKYNRSNYEKDIAVLVSIIQEVKVELASKPLTKLKLNNKSCSRSSILDTYENSLSRNKGMSNL
jgi:hypothetical protein